MEYDSSFICDIQQRWPQRSPRSLNLNPDSVKIIQLELSAYIIWWSVNAQVAHYS